MLSFVLTVKDHRHLGPIIIPYLVQGYEGKVYYSLYDKLSSQKLDRTDYLLNETERKLVKISDKYTDEYIVRRFSKKKLSAADFFDRIDSEILKKQVRPFVDSYISKLFVEVNDQNIPIYYADERNTNLYSADLLKYKFNSSDIVFNFQRNENGIHYWINLVSGNKTIKLMDTNPVFLSHDPAIFVLDDEIFYIKNTGAKKLTPFLKKEHISIPKSYEKEYFKTFIKKTLKENRVNPVGFEVKKPQIVPAPILTLTQDLEGIWALSLTFKYNDHEILSNDQQMLFVDFNDATYTFTLIVRNIEHELTYINKLKTIGIEKSIGAFYNIKYKSSEANIKTYELITWLKDHKEELQNSGFRIMQEVQSQQFFLGDMDFDLQVSQMEGDWFDINGKVTFGKFQIPFKALRSNILNKKRQFTLPDHSIAIIPEEWFLQYENLFLFSSSEKDHLKMGRHHYKLVEEIKKEAVESVDLIISQDAIEAIEVPSEVQATLRPYQEKGFQWLYYLSEQNFGGCLADDMGLGKTLQTICMLTKAHKEELICEHNQVRTQPESQLSLFDNPDKTEQIESTYSPPSLIIMPTSLVHNWYREIKKFAPHLKINIHSGQHRTNRLETFDNFDIILSSYGIVRNDIELLKNYTFRYIVLDESQFIKNPGSKNYRAILKLKGQNRMVLTGTPIENSVKDLWSQMNFLNPGLLGDLGFFTKHFVSPIEKNNDDHAAAKLKNLVHPFILRRTKEEVAKDLPDLSRQVMFCDMTEEQQSLYDEEKSKARNHILNTIKQQGIEKSAMVILRALMRLRQIANHPLLLDEKSEFESGKFELIKTHLEEIIAENHRVLIFSSFVKHLEIFEAFLIKQGIPYQMLTGSSTDRQQIVNDFQEKEIPVFLISLKAGGVGLNLTAADYVFILDPWWNPAIEEQAINRAHRIGQDKNVFVYRFISKDSIEEKIIALQEKKSQLADTFVNSANPFGSFSNEQIENLFT